MTFEEFIAKALKGRSINSVAKLLQIPQRSLDRWSKGQALPDWHGGMLLAQEAGIGLAELVEILAKEEISKKMSYNSPRVGLLAQLVEQRTLNP